MAHHPYTQGLPLRNFPGTNEVWLDKQDILQRLYISDRTLQRWRKSGLMPHIRIGGKIFYKLSDVMNLLETRCYYKVAK